MKVRIRPFSRHDQTIGKAQQNVKFRLDGGFEKYSGEDFDFSSEVLNDILSEIGNDPDALDEIKSLGVLRKIKSAAESGSECAVECFALLNQLKSSSRDFIFEPENRPVPYWVEFNDEFRLLLHYLKPDHKFGRNRPNFEVGFTLWGASVVLSRFLLENIKYVDGKDILELGSGLGLTGLTAAMIEESNYVWLTDFHSAVVENCKFNISLNNLERKCSAKVLDWEAEEDSNWRQFDLIIGSDVICQPSDGENISQVLTRFLKKNGTALFCLGSPASRYGVKEFPGFMAAAGFELSFQGETPGELSSWVSSEDQHLDFLVGGAASYFTYKIKFSGK